MNTTRIDDGVPVGRLGAWRRAIVAPMRPCLRDRSGATAIEAALGIPILLIATLFAFEISSVVYAQAELGFALSRATRFSMVMATADGAQITQKLSEQFMLLDPDNVTSVNVSATANSDQTRTATVTVTYRHDFLLPISPVESVPLSRSQSFLING